MVKQLALLDEKKKRPQVKKEGEVKNGYHLQIDQTPKGRPASGRGNKRSQPKGLWGKKRDIFVHRRVALRRGGEIALRKRGLQEIKRGGRRQESMNEGVGLPHYPTGKREHDEKSLRGAPAGHRRGESGA